MADQHPGLIGLEPDLQPPTVELKIVGKPRIQETDEPVYTVYLPLSRPLTVFEQESVLGWKGPAPSPAGHVYFADDHTSLAIIKTTIEKVAEYRDYFQPEVVSKIAIDGEARRKFAIDASLAEAAEQRSLEAERQRRKKLADEITFE